MAAPNMKSFGKLDELASVPSWAASPAQAGPSNASNRHTAVRNDGPKCRETMRPSLARWPAAYRTGRATLAVPLAMRDLGHLLGMPISYVIAQDRLVTTLSGDFSVPEVVAYRAELLADPAYKTGLAS